MKIQTSFGVIDAIHISFTATVHFASINTAASSTITRFPNRINLRIEEEKQFIILPSLNEDSIRSSASFKMAGQTISVSFLSSSGD